MADKTFQELLEAGMSKESVGLQCVQIKWWLSTGCPLLDYAMRPGHPPEKQGIPNGKWLELLGPEKSGKTALSFRIAKSCQDAGGHVIYFAAEGGTFDEFIHLCGVRTDPDYFTPAFPYSIESLCQAIENVVHEYHDKGRPILLIVDSISALESSDYTMDGQQFKKSTPQAAGAKAMHKFFRRGSNFYLQGAPIWGIAIRHETGSPRAFDFGVHTTHGKALDYYTWMRLRCTSKSFDEKYGGKTVGSYLQAQVIKSKVGPSYHSVSIPFYTGWGWDQATEQLHYLIDETKSLPEKGSGRYIFRGISMLRRELRDTYYNDPTAKAELDALVQVVLNNGGELPKL